MEILQHSYENVHVSLPSGIILNQLNKDKINDEGKYFKATEFKEYTLYNGTHSNDWKYDIPRESDTIMIHQLVIQLSDKCFFDDNLSSLKTFLNDLNNIHIDYGTWRLFSCNLKFCAKLNESNLKRNFLYNTITIDLPFKYMFNPIKQILLGNGITCVVDGNEKMNTYITSMSVVAKLTYLDTEPRLNLINEIKHDHRRELVQQFACTTPDDNISDPKHPEQLVLNLKSLLMFGAIKGFFIESNITLISKFVIKLNNDTIFDYNNVTLNASCVKLSKDLYYMPLHDDTFSYKDLSAESYLSSLRDNGKEYNLTCEISHGLPFDEKYINIYAIKANEMIYGGRQLALRMGH